MTPDQFVLFALLGVVFGALVWGRWRYDLVAFTALLAAVLLGLVPTERAFDGFGHPATVIVALVLVVSRGLVNSGAVQVIARAVTNPARSLAAHVAILGAAGAALSAFMNNVAALALLMPLDVQTARKAGRSPGLSLMPLSFATILGGMATLIGTPPNIIVASYREEALGASYGMFDFAPVGVVVALAGLAFVALVGWRLIPGRVPEDEGGAALIEMRAYVAELIVPEGAAIIGKRVAELDAEVERADVAVIAVLRGKRRLFGPARRVELRDGDRLVIEAAPDAIDEFRAALGLEFEGEARRQTLEAGEGMALIEVVVPEGARLAGRSALGMQLLRREGVTLLGISREGHRIVERVRRAPILPGDILLLLGPAERVTDTLVELGCLPLAERGLGVMQSDKALISIGVFAAAVAAASVGLVYLPIALGCVVAAYLFVGIVPVREVYDHIEWPVVVLLGSMIPLGMAFEATGSATLIASGLLDATAGFPAWVALMALMIVTMTLSDVLNNTATTIIAAPVAIDMARGLGASADPFLMAVAVAASCAFLTPIGHKNNTLVLGPGGYRFGDYWPMGLPLEIIVVATGVPAILIAWPL